MDNKKIKVEFTGDGYCTIYVTPEEGQYGDCVMTVHVQDPVGVTPEFSDTVYGKRRKKVRVLRKKDIEISEMDRILGNDQEDFVDYEEEAISRDENPRKWSVEDLSGWLFEQNFLMLKSKFIEDKVDGMKFLKMTQKDFVSYGVKKMKTKKQLEGWIQKLNDDADMREYALEQGKDCRRGKAGGKNKAATRGRIQRQNEETSTPGDSRPGTRGTSAGKSSVMTLSRPGTAHSSIDPWQAFVPSISHGVCTEADTDAYVVAFELGKIRHIHRIILRDSIFVDLTADDGRVCLASALALPFQKVVGIECRFGEFERVKYTLDDIRKNHANVNHGKTATIHINDEYGAFKI